LPGSDEPFKRKIFCDFIEDRRPLNCIKLNISTIPYRIKKPGRLIRYLKKINIGVSLNAAIHRGFPKIIGEYIFGSVNEGCRRILDQKKLRFFALFLAQLTVSKRNIGQVVSFISLYKQLGFDMVSISTEQFLAEY